MLNSKTKSHDTTYSFQFRNAVKKLPLGQINYHKKNYIKYFKEDIGKVKDKKFLETGAGSGIHTTILSLITNKNKNIIHSMDLLKSNIKKINKFKKLYKLKNVKVYEHNLLDKIRTNVFYDFSCCHNWVQHTPKPERCIKNIFDKIKVDGKFYISTYHENFFRFTIAFIARQIIKNKNKKKIIHHLIKNKNLVFDHDLSHYNNRDDIVLENLTDDFTTPYIFLTNYKRLKEFIISQGFKLITKEPKLGKVNFKDNHQLRMGFVKIKNCKKKIKKCFVNIDKEYEVMKSNKKYRDIYDFTKILKKKFKYKSYDSCSKLLLELYLFRAKTNKSKSKLKIEKLRTFLIRSIQY
tara:strand:- start:190 stop:1239 length:1050 start_codon:yes stop_codon:yes gene_type:complete